MGKGPTKKALRREREIRGTKAFAQRVHAKRRMAKQYGIIITRHDLEQMVAAIQGKNDSGDRAEFYDRKSNRITRWRVLYKGTWYPVVYDSNRKAIVTILPKKALQPAKPTS